LHTTCVSTHRHTHTHNSPSFPLGCLSFSTLLPSHQGSRRAIRVRVHDKHTRIPPPTTHTRTETCTKYSLSALFALFLAGSWCFASFCPSFDLAVHILCLGRWLTAPRSPFTFLASLVRIRHSCVGIFLLVGLRLLLCTRAVTRFGHTHDTHWDLHLWLHTRLLHFVLWFAFAVVWYGVLKCYIQASSVSSPYRGLFAALCRHAIR